MSKISVRFLIDEERKRVVFAEAGGDFVDVLFSFLTLPLGSIVRLLGKQSGLESLDNLYGSVEQLDAKYMQTEACKEMLLKPRSAAAIICEDLKIKNIHDSNPRTFYYCNESDCLVQSKCYYTYLTNGLCGRCGKLIMKNNCWSWSKQTTEKGGVFVNDRADFIITDDLRVIPTSLMSGFSLLEERHVKDTSILKERVFDFGTEEALNLLRMSFVSKRVLTDVIFPDAPMEPSVDCFSKIKDACIEPSVNCFSTIKDECFSMINEEIDGTEVEQKINVKIILNKKNNNVLYAEVREDFVDQLLSFLTFPLGSVFELLPDHILLKGDHVLLKGCISNLYFSAESLSLEYFKSEEYKDMVVYPDLASYHGCKNQLLKLDEMVSKKWTCSSSCMMCFRDNGNKLCPTTPCKHGLREAELIEQNSKLENAGSDSGGGFVEGPKRFMIDENLHISPISSISAITKGMNFLISDLVEKEVCIDNAKVLSLLSAMLISKTVLTDVFSPKPKQRRRCQYS